jgi:pimeloyl-ACP methyl ester carboxylesterase
MPDQIREKPQGREGYIAVRGAQFYFREIGNGQAIAVLHGDHDLVPVEYATHIAEAMPGSRLIVLRECGHFAYLERPAEVLGAPKRILSTRAETTYAHH